MNRPARPVLLLHAGATLDAAYADPERAALALDRVFLQSHRTLEQGASALEAVSTAVAAMEVDPQFNAGLGGKLQQDGIVRLSASVMDGARQRFAAVLNVERVHHPSRLALHLLDADDRILDGTGASALAEALGEPRLDPTTAQRRQQWEAARAAPAARSRTGTVGAVALDSLGRLAAMTSTGGKGSESPGRVSDSAMPAGNYADAQLAVSCTGLGEDIVDHAVAARLAAWVGAGMPLVDAADRMEAELRAAQRRCGFIALDAQGGGAIRWTTAAMAHRWIDQDALAGWPLRPRC